MHRDVILERHLSGNTCTQEAKTHIVVAILRRVVVAIPRTQVLRIVVPRAATYNAVGASNHGHYAKN